MPKKRLPRPARRSARTRLAPPAAPAPRQESGPPRIVGIGASAGGLEALTQFFSHLPDETGLAFVIVQHLDPTRPGALPGLLQRATRMEVAQVVDQARVMPDKVYVIPPNADLSVLRGVFHLLEPASPRGLRLPIDFFFRALADDQGQDSVGIVLSGMGTDGTLGVKAIKEHGGLVLVQEPASAGFDSMPRSAVSTGLVDLVAPAEELPARLLAVLRHAPARTPEDRLAEGPAAGALEQIVDVLRAASGHDFSQYKKSTLQRRVERRMGLHQLTTIASYVPLLQRSPQEQALLFSELLIGVTSFFRDPPAWAVLRNRVFPELLARHPGGRQLRAWAPGCSTGEEAYTLAMTFQEALAEARPRASFSLQIFATDLGQGAIEKARQGVYPANVAADLSPGRLRRFFVQEEDGAYRVCKEVREMVILAPHDLTRDPPYTRLDLIVCRNLLIYLEPELQGRLLPLFHHALVPGGVLFLGSSETTGSQTELFAPIDAKSRIYQRKETAARLEPAAFPSSYRASRVPPPPAAARPRPATSLQALAEELILRQVAPAAVLVGKSGDVLYFSGRTGKFLEPASGKASWNVFDMARGELGPALASAIPKALGRKRPVGLTGLSVDGRSVEVSIRPLQESNALHGLLLVVFTEAASRPATAAAPRSRRGRAAEARVAQLERELRQATAELATNREEMQASQEEIRSSNEELQSMNEELQSTNEELTTSKEELQSMNEELQTVNGELQAKLDELSRTSNDMKNLLDATDIATVFLDRDLRIRRFTSRATRLVKLIPGDVGRPVTDLASELLGTGLAKDVREVLRTLVPSEKQVATGGRWFSVRILPYRTMDDAIDGVAITMSEITASKALEAELRASRERFAALIRRLPEGVTIMDEAGRLVPEAVALTRIGEATAADFAGWTLVVARP